MRPVDARATRTEFECICGNKIKHHDIYGTLEIELFSRDETQEDKWIGGGGPGTEDEIHLAICSDCLNSILEVTKNAIASLTRTETVEPSNNTSTESSTTVGGQPISGDSDNPAHESTI